jgi:hypothetical protein
LVLLYNVALVVIALASKFFKSVIAVFGFQFLEIRLGIKDRIWPDFLCHFSLFRGVHLAVSGFINQQNSSWTSIEENIDVSQRSPTRLRPNLDFLKASSARDNSSASAFELAKFGFCPDKSAYGIPSSMVHYPMVQSDLRRSPPVITFGSFKDPVFVDLALNFPIKLLAQIMHGCYVSNFHPRFLSILKIFGRQDIRSRRLWKSLSYHLSRRRISFLIFWAGVLDVGFVIIVGLTVPVRVLSACS